MDDMPTHRSGSPLFALPALLVGAVVALLSSAAHAETHLAGQVDAIRMEARDASIEEILSALGAAYGLRFSTITPLNDHIAGTYEGPLLKIVARVLDRFNYVAKTKDGIVEVAVLGAHQTVALPTTLPPAPTTLPPSPAAPPSAAAGFVDPRKPAPIIPPASARIAPDGPPRPLDWEMRTNVANPRH
jgi:hypothetical protein